MQGGAGGMGHPKFGGVGGRGGRVFVEAKEGKLSWLLVLIRNGHVNVLSFKIYLFCNNYTIKTYCTQ